MRGEDREDYRDLDEDMKEALSGPYAWVYARGLTDEHREIQNELLRLHREGKVAVAEPGDTALLTNLRRAAQPEDRRGWLPGVQLFVEVEDPYGGPRDLAAVPAPLGEHRWSARNVPYVGGDR